MNSPLAGEALAHSLRRLSAQSTRFHARDSRRIPPAHGFGSCFRQLFQAGSCATEAGDVPSLPEQGLMQSLEDVTMKRAHPVKAALCMHIQLPIPTQAGSLRSNRCVRLRDLT